MDVYVALPTDSRRRHLAATNDLFRGMKGLAEHWTAVVSPRYNIVQKLCHCFAGAIGEPCIRAPKGAPGAGFGVSIAKMLQRKP
jgi:hypothetical protein